MQAQQEAIVAEGVLRTRARLVYEITRAEVSQLAIEVPADQKVVNVFDPNVRQWEVKAGEGGVQTIEVQLFQPTRGTQNISVELEKFSAEMQQQELSVPMVKALNVGRQQGVLVVQLSSGLRAEPTARTGLMQLDAGELPQNLARGGWAFAYRYASVPYELKLSVEKVQPRILAEELVEAYLEPEQLTLDLFASYTIERAGVFQLELDIPAGFDVRQVRGHGCMGAEAAAVDAWHAEGDNKTRLIVNLGRKAMGKIGLFVELSRRLNDANLLSPTGETSDVAVPLARVASAGVERRSGRLVVYAPESLRLNPTKQDGLRAISFDEAFAGMESTRGGRFNNLRPVLAMAFTDQPADLTLEAERRKPHITAAQLLAVQVDAGVVKYEATFFYDIRYSGVKTLRIDVPQTLAADIRNQTAGVREKTIDPQPDGVAEGYVAWSFAGESELNGQTVIKLVWERKLEKLEIGKSVDLELPHLRPIDVDRAWGQIVLSKAETIDVQPAGEPKGLRPIDPRHDLMAGASVPDAARAFEFHEDWSLAIKATRYKLEEVKRTSIERALVRAVATRSDLLAVQALYRLRSAEQRLSVSLPAGVEFDTQPLKINGRSVQLERGDKDEFFIPLVGQNPDEPFVLELRYTTPGSAKNIELPHFPNDPAIQKVYLAAYLPKELTLLGSQGPWADELTWVSSGSFDQQPRPRLEDTLSGELGQRRRESERNAAYHIRDRRADVPVLHAASREAAHGLAAVELAGRRLAARPGVPGGRGPGVGDHSPAAEQQARRTGLHGRPGRAGRRLPADLRQADSGRRVRLSGVFGVHRLAGVSRDDRSTAMEGHRRAQRRRQAGRAAEGRRLRHSRSRSSGDRRQRAAGLVSRRPQRMASHPHATGLPGGI